MIIKNISVASDNQKAFHVLSEDNKIQSLNSLNGEVNWLFEIGETDIWEPSVSDKSLYIAGDSETIKISADNNDEIPENVPKNQKVKQVFLRSVSTNTGIPEWSAKADLVDKTVSESVEESDRKIYLLQNGDDIVLLDSNGNLFLTKKNKESLQWLRKFDSPVIKFFDLGLSENNKSNPSRSIFAFYGTDKRFYLVTASTGEILDSFPQPYIVTSAVLLSSSEIVIGDEKGNIFLINTENKNKPKAVWIVKTGAAVSSLSLTSEGILVTSLDNFAYLINPVKGNRIWKKRLSGRLLYQALIIENEKIFVVVENESAYFISLKSGAILKRITLAAGDYFINTPVLLNNLYIFPTNSGIIAYSDFRCP